MSATIDIRRNGADWNIEDGSARIRITMPGAGMIERFVDQWEGQGDHREAPKVPSSERGLQVRR